MADDLLDQREAMSLLGMNENDLLQVVARGDLRAFRSTGTLRFRRDDVLALKNEKGTEPTIIIPAAMHPKTAHSGILPTVGTPPARPPSRVMPRVTSNTPISAAAVQDKTGEIVLDDIELMPSHDDAGNTQHVTVAQTAVDHLGGQTVMEPISASSEMTLLEPGGDIGTGPAAPVITGSGRRTAVGSAIQTGMGAPAMSRVRSAVQVSPGGVSMATSKRTQAAYQTKSANPIWTGVMVLNSVVFMLAASIFAVMVTKGGYDPESKQRIIPPFLNQNSVFSVYKWTYDKIPGKPEDKKPSTEYDGGN